MMHGISPEESALREAPSILTIDLSALAENWRTLSRKCGRSECAAVVKASAYGLGIERVAPALWNAGAETFFVAHLSEGVRLREILPQAVIYVLNGLLPGTAPTFARSQLRPALGSTPEIAEWSDFCAAEKVDLPAAIHLDTGMHRLGLSVDETLRLADTRRLLAFTPSLMMSHLACADEKGNPATERQLAVFTDLVRRFPDVPASLANSAGTMTGQDYHFDLVRPGIALYGGAPIGGGAALNPVVKLQARVIQVLTAERGEGVGYGGAEHTRRETRIATLSLGYADGVFRSVGSSDARPGAAAIIAGRRCPLIGRVSMDLMSVDVTELPEGAVERGDLATLIGDGITLDAFAAVAGTISYEILTSLGHRHLRRYLGG